MKLCTISLEKSKYKYRGTNVTTSLEIYKSHLYLGNSASAWQRYLWSESGLAEGVVAIVSVCHTIQARWVQADRKGIAIGI